MKAWMKFAALGAGAVMATAALTWADKESDADSAALRSAPPAVQSAVLQLAGMNKINEFDSETENGKTVYDLEYAVKGGTYEADIDPSGQILTREVDVDASIVPPAVIAAAKAAHDGAKIGEASIVAAGDQLFYELDVKAGKDTHEMRIGAGGSVIADSIEAPEAPDADNDKGGEAGDKEDKD
jgi:uncharacterized membrane protein YkoI